MISKAIFLLSVLLIFCEAAPKVLRLADTNVTNKTCPLGWFRYGTRCFKFVSDSRTWAESERYCVMMGANLASVHSTGEYYFIQELVRRHTHDTPCAWIGGSDAAQEGLWLWSDGSRFDYSHWDSANPSNGWTQDNGDGPPENCAHINYKGSLRWNDVACNILYPSVCTKVL